MTFRSRFIALVLLGASQAAAGSLVPPGAPAPTMLAIDSAEPRKPISSVPFTINSPGSYYLTKNLTMTVPTGSAIVVNTTERVTIDLRGFTLDGANLGASGITSFGGSGGSLAIRNGLIKRFWYGVSAGGRTTLEDLQIEANTADGAGVSDTLVTRCNLNLNGQSGLNASGNAIVRDSRAGANGLWGMYLQGSGGSIEDSVIDLNNTSMTTGFGGLHVGQATLVRNCVVARNKGNGIEIGDRVYIADNNIYGNSGDGIRTATLGESRIEGNSVTSNSGVGIFSDSGGNYIVRNSARGNLLGAFTITGSGNVAPIEVGTANNANSNVSY